MFGRKKTKIVPTGRVIDMTRTGWGHNIEVWPQDTEKPAWTGFIWVTPGARVGDKIRWKTEYGQAVVLVTECQWTGNVDDMYRITVELVERVVNG